MKEVWKVITELDSLNIYTHNGPDGDSIGTCVAIKRMLTYHNPNISVKVVMLDPVAGKLASCPVMIDVSSTDSQAQAYLYPDTPIVKMTPHKIEPSMSIDHHASRTPFAHIDYVKDWPSCAGLLLNEWRKMGLIIPPSVAEALLIGAVTDTGCGIYGSRIKRKQALEDITTLDEISGKYTPDFLNTFYGLSLEQEAWLGQVYPHILVANECMTLILPKEVSEGRSLSDRRMCLQELTHRIPAQTYIWGYPNKDRMRFSVRSNTIDMLPFAQKYNGAGHKGAASFEIDNSKAQEVLEDFRQHAKQTY